MSKVQTKTMDGFGKVKPLTEGYEVKGGINTTSRIVTRPPPPGPMRAPAGSVATKPPTSK